MLWCLLFIYYYFSCLLNPIMLSTTASLRCIKEKWPEWRRLTALASQHLVEMLKAAAKAAFSALTRDSCLGVRGRTNVYHGLWPARLPFSSSRAVHSSLTFFTREVYQYKNTTTFFFTPKIGPFLRFLLSEGLVLVALWCLLPI